LFRAKKSEIHRRAKRLLNAFASETRRRNLMCAKRKIIRAHYENGHLIVKEDFVRLPNLYASNLQFQIVNNLFTVLKNQLHAKRYRA
jgi:hypothetical protein